ncbi:MAG: hypothetical protein L0Z73_02860 [Gammaproteobacteria bacterium]|nr:hypothetical protein [Gammaproteobacteria bacterium]
MNAQAPFTDEQIEERLDACVDAVLSSRRTAAGPAQRLGRLTRAQQQLVLYWVDIVSKSNKVNLHYR